MMWLKLKTESNQRRPNFFFSLRICAKAVSPHRRRLQRPLFNSSLFLFFSVDRPWGSLRMIRRPMRKSGMTLLLCDPGMRLLKSTRYVLAINSRDRYLTSRTAISQYPCQRRECRRCLERGRGCRNYAG